MEYLQGALGGARGSGVNSWGIDSSHNRILFGVETRETLPTMVSWLVGKGIPCGLVAVEVTGPIRVSQTVGLDVEVGSGEMVFTR
jgi:hypothetical protein